MFASLYTCIHNRTPVLRTFRTQRLYDPRDEALPSQYNWIVKEMLLILFCVKLFHYMLAQQQIRVQVSPLSPCASYRRSFSLQHGKSNNPSPVRGHPMIPSRVSWQRLAPESGISQNFFFSPSTTGIKQSRNAILVEKWHAQALKGGQKKGSCMS